MASDIDLVVRACRDLEQLLTRQYGAQGRGLHAQVSSVEGKLPEPAVKALRFVATMRNRVVHTSDLNAAQRKAFKQAVAQVRRQLRASRRRKMLGAIVVLCTCAVVAFLTMQ